MSNGQNEETQDCQGLGPPRVEVKVIPLHKEHQSIKIEGCGKENEGGKSRILTLAL